MISQDLKTWKRNIYDQLRPTHVLSSTMQGVSDSEEKGRSSKICDDTFEEMVCAYQLTLTLFH